MKDVAQTGRFAILAVLAFSVSCGGGDGGTTNPGVTPVAAVDVSPQSRTLAPTQTLQLTATAKDASGQTLTGRTITWSTSAAERATVSESGLVTALTPGAVTITATSEGKSGTAAITIEAPIASVAITPPASNTIVPEQTLQLNAVVKDVTGATMTGQQITWTTSQNAVATVSNNGLVTAIAPGATTITASSGGKGGTLDVTVEAGVLVGSTGRTVIVDNGNVELTIPAGAVTTPTAITVTKLAQPTTPLPNYAVAVGPTYRLGPAGITFSQPVTVKLKYDRSMLPVWAMSGDLSIQRNNGTAWNSLTDIVVDGQANTVMGKTTGFPASKVAPFQTGNVFAQDDDGSDHTIQALNPHAVLSPQQGSVNFQQRAVSFSVGLEPRGAAIPSAPFTQPSGNPGVFKYRWSTSGQNGVLGAGGTSTGWTTQSTMQYVATNPVLNQLSGTIDNITVEVLLNPAAESNPGPRDIATTSGSIDADLDVTWDINPEFKDVGRGEAAQFQLRIRDKQGNSISLPQKHEIVWTSSENHGDIPDNVPKTQTTLTYTAKSTFNTAPPRVDDIMATINKLVPETKRVPIWGGLLGLELLRYENQTTETPVKAAEVKAFATIDVEYQVKLLPSNKTLAPGGSQSFEVTLDPPNEIPAANLVYKYLRIGDQGSLSVENSVETPSKQVTYTAKGDAAGGSDQVKVEVFTKVAGVILESVGTATATVQVDALRANFSIFTQSTPAHPEGFVAARISIPKVDGATSYEVTATTPDGPYSKTFSGAESADQRAIGQVIDGGSVWHINLEAGFSSTDLGVNGRKQAYQNKYGSVVFNVKVSQ